MLKTTQDIMNYRPSYDTFDHSHEHAFTMPFGKLVPFLCKEVYPGDLFRVNALLKAELQQSYKPIIGKVEIHFEYFYVRHATLMPPTKWSDYILNQYTGEQKLDIPKISKLHVYPNKTFDKTRFEYDDKPVTEEYTALYSGSLLDYMGVPTFTTATTDSKIELPLDFQINALPFLAYYNIWSHDERNQWFDDKIKMFDYDDPKYAVKNFHLMKVQWAKDYFTDIYPDVQKGTPPVIPMQGSLDFQFEDYVRQIEDPRGLNYTIHTMTKDTIDVTGVRMHGDGLLKPSGTTDNAEYTKLILDKMFNSPQTTNLGFDINQFNYMRMINASQILSMNNGDLYQDNIQGLWGVDIGDDTLQYPVSIGGGSFNIFSDSIYQLSEGTEKNPLGERAGTNEGRTSTENVEYRCSDYGTIIGVMKILVEPMYTQGMPKMFMKNTALDWYNPLFGDLPPQPIDKRELFIDWNNPESFKEKIFAYTTSYEYLRTDTNKLSGEVLPYENQPYRSMARMFDENVAANEQFLYQDADVNRVYAVNEELAHPVVMQATINCSMSRPLTTQPTIEF